MEITEAKPEQVDLKIEGISVKGYSHSLPYPYNQYQNSEEVSDWIKSHKNGSLVSMDGMMRLNAKQFYSNEDIYISPFNLSDVNPNSKALHIIQAMAEKQDILLSGDFTTELE